MQNRPYFCALLPRINSSNPLVVIVKTRTHLQTPGMHIKLKTNRGRNINVRGLGLPIKYLKDIPHREGADDTIKHSSTVHRRQCIWTNGLGRSGTVLRLCVSSLHWKYWNWTAKRLKVGRRRTRCAAGRFAGSGGDCGEARGENWCWNP